MTSAATEPAPRAWRLMLEVLTQAAPVREQALRRRGLTSNDVRGLSCLDEAEGRPIGGLANEWGCDPSTATFIVDRLERAGLAKRQLAAADRRVKLVVLTRRGARVRAELADEVGTPPAAFERLSPADLEVLEYVLRKLTPAQPAGGA